jgi:hypothetical protein
MVAEEGCKEILEPALNKVRTAIVAIVVAQQ